MLTDRWPCAPDVLSAYNASADRMSSGSAPAAALLGFSFCFYDAVEVDPVARRLLSYSLPTWSSSRLASRLSLSQPLDVVSFT